MGNISLVLADDHAMVREGIKNLLELQKDFVIYGEAKNGVECMELVSYYTPDVLLLDINMPEMSGIDILKKFNDLGLKQKTLILTVHDEKQYMEKALEYGATGYVLKDSDYDTLCRAIREVYNGELFIDKKLLPYMTETETHKKSDDIITRREREVLTLVAQGYINKEIGMKLNISEKTVKNHVSNLFKKIGVNDRTQAAVYAIKNNYVDIL